jgi:uncharacterized protein
MRWNVAGLLQDDLGAIRLYELNEPPYEIDPGIVTTAPLTGAVKLTRTNRGILAEARIKTTVRQECSRCLEDAMTPVAGRIAEEFFPTVDLRTGTSVERPEGDGYMLTDAHELDLAEPVRQAVLLEQPMKPLCQPDCRGLCPRCGQNLNERECTCTPEPADARLSRLADWLKSNQSS